MAAHNLPEYTSPFIGREVEVANIGERLNDPNCRLLTLIGPGGIGKTRLAIEAASQSLDSYADGVYFVPLQPVASIDNIVPRVASAIHFGFHSASDPKSQLFEHLRARHLLFILDNLEHLLAAGDMIVELLASAPQVKLLVTSHEALNLRDEWLYQVEGLPYPEREPSSGIEAYGAVSLFVHHARRVQRDFSLDNDREAVIRICQLVQGMPLGIELATTWLRRLPCAEIARELQYGLDILETDLRDVPDRHRSMRVVFNHSWKLLSQEERNVFMGLSVFRGGFRRDAAESVVSASLPILMSLVDKSMLKINSEGRYVIHELQRQYAEERLEAIPEQSVRVRDQHSAYYTAFVDRPVSDFLGAENLEILWTMDAEIDNVRLAWDWAVVSKQVNHLARALQGLYWYAWLRSWHEEGESAFQQAVTVFRAVEPTTAAQIALGRALALQANMDIWLRRSARARERAQESVSILRPLNAREDLARALGSLGWAALAQREFVAAKAPLEEAVALNKETGRYEIQAFTMGQLAYIAESEGDRPACERWHLRALRLGRRIGDQRTIAHELGSLGKLARQRGQYIWARQLFEESLSVAQAAEIDAFTIDALQQLGVLAEMTGELDAARDHIEMSLRLARDYRKTWTTAWSLIHLADILVAQGEYQTARQHYQQAQQVTPEADTSLVYANVVAGLGELARLSGDYGSAWQHHHESLESHRQMNHRAGIIRNVVALGRVALAQGKIGSTRRLLLEALQEAIASDWLPTILDIFATIAELFEQEGNRVDAQRLATLVHDHPASTANARDRASVMLTGLQARSATLGRAHSQQQSPLDDLDSVTARLLEQLAPTVEQPLIEPLSERELEVLRLVASGMTNEDIASQLVLAVGTVKRHLYNINAKLDTGNRTQAVKRARDLALL